MFSIRSIIGIKKETPTSHFVKPVSPKWKEINVCEGDEEYE